MNNRNYIPNDSVNKRYYAIKFLVHALAKRV